MLSLLAEWFGIRPSRSTNSCLYAEQNWLYRQAISMVPRRGDREQDPASCRRMAFWVPQRDINSPSCIRIGCFAQEQLA